MGLSPALGKEVDEGLDKIAVGRNGLVATAAAAEECRQLLLALFPLPALVVPEGAVGGVDLLFVARFRIDHAEQSHVGQLRHARVVEA